MTPTTPPTPFKPTGSTPTASSPTGPKSAKPPQTPPLPQVEGSPKILVVDDRPANRYLISHVLRRSGFEVIEAATGKEALALVHQLPVVVVLDIKLPDILGYEVCRRIKANALTSHIPVLQLSAFLSDESKVYSLDSGADAFLTHPVEPSVLTATVRSLVRLHDAEARARRSGEQWQATFDALSEGVALVDSDGIIQRVNRAMTAILNRTYTSLEGRPIRTLIAESFGPEIANELALNPGRPSPSREILTREVQTHEVQVDTRYFRFSLSPIQTNGNFNNGNFNNGGYSGSVFILAEITEQKRAQTAFVVNERLAATGRMANTIAHEINNPLEAITNLLYLLANSIDSPQLAAQYLATTQEQLARVSRIVRQILSFNRETASPVAVHLFELLDDVLALNNRAIVEKKLQIKKLWDRTTRVEGYPAQLRQVFSNLLRNAVEASSAGGKITVKISCCQRASSPGQDAARVTFSDQGTGIPKNNLRRVFEAFFTTKELKGSGVGLWLSSTIVQEHNGRIQVRSSTRPGRSGTCISVLLPCHSPKSPQAESPTPP